MTELTPGRAFVRDREDSLRALIDAVVPADDFPSASAAGGLDFLGSILDERPDWMPRVEAVLRLADAAAEDKFEQDFATLPTELREPLLDQLSGNADFGWFARMVQGGYYADPANGGNRGARSWSMIGWRADPPGGWPDLPPREDRRVVVTPETVADRYDAIVIGSGAGGGVAARGLAEAGRKVLVVEAGAWPETATLASDHLRNPRSTWWLDVLSGPMDAGNPRTLMVGNESRTMRPSDPQWGNNAFTVGGGTRVYGAQAWRFGPKDFAMASTYGVPEGSDLADWPIGYDEMAPYYEKAEWEIGVAGDSVGAHAGTPARPFPMPPVAPGLSRDVLFKGAEKLGFATHAVPLLVNSVAYGGRDACVQCPMCVGFACPVDAKSGSANTMLDRAFATGNAAILLETVAERLLTNASGKVVGVALVGTRDGKIWRREVRADEIVLSAGAVETARLLLNSTSVREPRGIGNTADQVGRRLQGHAYGGAVGIFDGVVEDLRGPGPSLAVTQFRHDNPGIVGGGLLANEFVPTPSNVYRYLADSGLIPLHGRAAKAEMRENALRFTRVMGPIQEVTGADNRVTIDPDVRDRFGIPVARLSGRLHPEDMKGRDFLSRTAADWLAASGAKRIAAFTGPRPQGPSSGQHQAGTCRMGDDPARSVTDKFGRVWGHDNLRIADGSLHVTNGGANPVLTIYANAMRVIDHMVGNPSPAA
jgi:choline dehydrogenase-like flavoprotein